MCHEFWRYEETRAADDAAKRRARATARDGGSAENAGAVFPQIIDKAKSAPPASPPASPATSEKEKETVPA